ncbi:hypothetical protein JHK82_041971 [Glycine max]|uniref:Plastocyanin-like domain-containing protein n=2 Tax=Glycine subgen. Soja TaxID=1462606 RepID=A0A0R0FZ34_SOYBN|nr:hypothetical protein JHK86_042026 [Glycine max]RZB64059.1 L-ascorbate oxidase-like [Glycine soja]KAG4956262.1 hypothetical protein JHK85_042642 [Glycine max]KAG5105001.1 hypothetical protein JHK82_041971 [Glycine max]KAG5116125.1 hypothetical protein JHK84_042238 [Glycine max]
MRLCEALSSLILVLALAFLYNDVNCEDPYRFFTWKLTYGDIYPLGVKQQGILINGKFPGPLIDPVTNDNLIINVHNYLREPLLISWNGLQQRRNSWQDGIHGTNCPIPPGKNYTYVLQVKTKWRLNKILNDGHNLPFPHGLLINGRGWNGTTFTVDKGKTYRFGISNVGLTTSINFRIQGHKMKLVKPAKNYYIDVSTRFTKQILTTTSILHYNNSSNRVSGPIPQDVIASSLFQARTIRWNLTASRPRPNPQGSYQYGLIKPIRTIILENSAPIINGKQRYAINGVSYVAPDIPLKLADYFNISGVFSVGRIPTNTNKGKSLLQTSVMGANFHEFVEIVFQNWENFLQSWHIDGYSFFGVGFSSGQWTPTSRAYYNLRDAIPRCTTQVYPKSWAAIYIALDNVGMWNVRSENWARQYLGQQFYHRVYTSSKSYGEMNIRSQRMHFFVAGPEVATL